MLLMTRGINQSFEVWKMFMQSQMFDFRQQPLLKDDKGNFIEDGVDENGNKKYKRGPQTMTRVQGALRPIQLFEYVFPEESLQEVLAMMNQHKQYNHMRPEVNNYAWILRKMTRFKKIPDMPELQKKEAWEITQKYVPPQGVGVYPLGIKEDKKQDFIFGDVGFYQEGL